VEPQGTVVGPVLQSYTVIQLYGHTVIQYTVIKYDNGLINIITLTSHMGIEMVLESGGQGTKFPTKSLAKHFPKNSVQRTLLPL
jgi:hypothetical protein